MSDSNKITGKVHEILDLETFGSGFQKRSLILETNPQYPQYPNIEFVQDKIDLLDHYKVGDEVTVHFNVNGRRWESPTRDVKYFNSLVAWRIEKAGDGTETSERNLPTASAEEAFNKPAESKNVFADDDSDDLPF